MQQMQNHHKHMYNGTWIIQSPIYQLSVISLYYPNLSYVPKFSAKQ